jgi:hypothetical protein
MSMILFLYDSYIVTILTILDQCIELIKAKLVILFDYRITRVKFLVQFFLVL